MLLRARHEHQAWAWACLWPVIKCNASLSAAAVPSLNEAMLIYKAQRCCTTKPSFATDLCNRSFGAVPLLLNYATAPLPVNLAADPCSGQLTVIHA